MGESGSKTWNVVVLPGDGIGPEVIAEGVKVLRATERHLAGVSFSLRECSAGAGAYRETGSPLPDEVFRACEESEAVLLGAMGDPEVRWPDGREMTPQIDLRERLDLFCGLRPLRLFHDHDCRLKLTNGSTIDLLLVRENTEGLFSQRQTPRVSRAGEAQDVMRITREGSERVFRSAFNAARRRRRHVTLVDKANVLPSMAFFREVFDVIAGEFPDVQTDRVYVDAAALYLVQRPAAFDVLVTENMFGDILSDLAAGLVGGMGMAPSADIGPRHAVFQPAHGSAPDITGQSRANPVATILSVALMLDWLDHPETRRGAEMIREATACVLADPTQRTPDLGGSLRTEQLGDLIAQAVDQHHESS